MKKLIVTMLLAVWAGGLCATPISFIAVEYSTGSFAKAGGATDSAFDSSLLHPLPPPLLTSSPKDQADFKGAAAAGTADNGFLGVFAQAEDDPKAVALASAEFIGTFTAPNFFHLTLNFDTQSSGNAEGLLLISLLNNGLVAFEQTFSSNLVFDRVFNLDAGTATLDLLLFSSAYATQGDALNLATVSFQTAAVPEPSVLFLSILGLGLLGSTHRFRFGRKARFTA